MPEQTTTDRPTTLAYEVVRAVARREGVSPTDLTPPLYDAVDADALGRLVDGDRTPGARIAFEYNGYEVTVSGDSTVEVRPR